MKKLILTLAAIPLAASAVGASAQTNSYAGGAVGVENRIANLEARYSAGLSAGIFSAAERNAISRQLTDLRRLEQSYSANGLTQAERRTLQQRIRTVRDQIRVAGGTAWAGNYGWSDAELDAYASGYGSGTGYDRYGRPVPNSGVAYDSYGRPIANNDVLYDRYGRPVANNDVTYDRYGRPVANNSVTYDRYGRPVANDSVTYDRYGRPVANNNVTYDRYGRPVNTGVSYDRYGRPVPSGDYYGQGGPYEPVPQSSRSGGVLGGVLGSVIGGGSGVGGILGSILGRGGLRTGDVITSTIGSVLGSARTFGPQYQDSGSLLYRTDGERVYAIDSHTNTVVQVYTPQR
jgi:hypothetical protein